MTLNELRDMATKIAKKNGFVNATPFEDIALIHSEVSEALEELRANMKPNETYYETKDGPPDKPCGVPSEMADIIIRVLHFCGKHAIDIERAVNQKMIYNESRSFKHGGKAL